MPVPVRADLPAPPLHVDMSGLSDPRRLAALRDTGLLHGASNPVLDGIARVTAQALGVPIAFVALVDDRRQHLPGLAGPYGEAGEVRGTPLSQAVAPRVVVSEGVVLIPDAGAEPEADVLAGFAAPGGRAFAGVPLRLHSGHVLGALCAVHVAPVSWGREQVVLLEDLAAAAVAEIERLVLGQRLDQVEVHWQAMAERDALTGVLNRRGFMEQTRHHLALAQRTAAPFSIAVIDIDRFRSLNDVFGHEMGDRALVELAALLQTVARETDLIARLDGDQFALLLCNTTRDEAVVFRRRFDGALAERNAEPGREYQLQASLGLSSWTLETPHTLATLLRVAEESMHIEKGQRAGPRASGAERLSSGGFPD